MQALKEWVRALVLLVLLAGFLEMLLPTGSMKKYVRMTIGLLIVLAIIKPMVGFLGHSVSVDWNGWEPKRGSVPSIDQIMADAGRFREQNWSLALSEARKKLESEASQAARTVKGVTQAEATVDLTQQAGEVKLVGLTVGVQTGDSSGGVQPVKPVQPVRIGRTAGGGSAVGSGRGPTGGAAGGGGSAPPDAGQECSSTPSGAASSPTTAPPSPAPAEPCQAVATLGAGGMSAVEKALADAVRQEVAKRLGIPAENQMIRVVVNGGK